MQTTYVVTGNLEGARTIVLDEALPVNRGKVRVTVELLSVPEPQRPYGEV